MERKKVLKALQINFATAILAAIIAAAAFETGYLTKGILLAYITETDLYYIQVAAIMLTIAIVPFALKIFSRAMSKGRALNDDEHLKLYNKKSLQRIFLLFIPLVINIFIYYGLDYDGSMYCALVSLGALIYSCPTGKTLDDCQGERGTK